MDYFYKKVVEIKDTKIFYEYKNEIIKLKNNKEYIDSLKEKDNKKIYEFEKNLREKEKELNELFFILECQKIKLLKGDEDEDRIE